MSKPIPVETEALGRLPLRPGPLAVLASLAGGPAPGIAVLEHAERMGSGSIVLGPGTLYRLLRELSGDGLIERTAAPAGADGAADDRRQYYGLTQLGRAVLEAEADRLRRTLAGAGLLAAGRRT
ncbi:MAG: PadR family transcriptional regulator [Gemmatimonadetes bacterium]|nr:PadR family transcriptional regulator [Gemmatimonadota bacterium]